MNRHIVAAAAGIGLAFAARSENEMLYHMSFETIGDNGVALQNDGGTLTSVTPQLLDSGYVNYITTSGTIVPKFGTYAYRSNGGTIGIMDDTNGLASVDTGFTVSFWFYPETVANWRSFFGFGFLNGNNYGYEKNAQSSLQINGYGYTSGGNTTLNTGIAVNAGAWNHLALVCEPGAASVKVYINGTAYDVTDTSGMEGSLSQILLTRRRNATGASAALRQERQTVSYDEFALYNFAATADQVAWLMAHAASTGVFSGTEVSAEGDITATEINGLAGDATDVVLSLPDGARITFDTELTASTLTVKPSGSFSIAGPEGVASPSASNLAKLSYAAAAPVTFLYDTSAVATASKGNIYKGGAGSVSVVATGATTNVVAITHAGGYALLDGCENTHPYYLSSSENSTASTVVFTNANVFYNTGISVGTATYVAAGTTEIVCGPNANNQAFYLSNGLKDRTSVFTVKDSAKVRVLGVNNVDSNRGRILFGHFNGTSTFNLQDSAEFSAEGEVLVGKTSGTHTINVSGGTFRAEGVKVSSGAGGSQTMNISGGSLVLGDVGVDAYGSYTMQVNVTGDATIAASAAAMPFTQPLNVASGKVLSFAKASAVDAATVGMECAFTGEGAVSVGEGVTLALASGVRPRLASVSGNVSITLDDAELAAGTVSIPTTLSEAPSTDSFSVYDGSTAMTVDSVSVSGSAISVAFSSTNPLITESISISSLPADTQGSLTVVGGDAENPIVVDFDAALPDGVTGMTIRGTVNVCGGEFPHGLVSFADNAVIVTTDDKLFTNTVNTVSYIVKGGTLMLSIAQDSCEPAGVTVESGGVFDINGYANKSYPITLAGGTLKNSGNYVGEGAMQFWEMTLTADSYIDTPNTFGSIASGYNVNTFNLNGHTLTKRGSGMYIVANPAFAGGGRIVAESGKVRLIKGGALGSAATDSVTLEIGSGAELTMESETGKVYAKTGTLNLVNNGTLTVSTGCTALPAFDSKSGTGTVVLKNCWGPARLDFADFKLADGALVSNGNNGWIPTATNGYGFPLELVDNGTTPALRIANGTAGKNYFFSEIAGSGTFSVNPDSWTGSAVFLIHAVSNFTGSVVAKRPIHITSATSGTVATTGSITVDAGFSITVPSGKTWDATGAFVINGGVGGSGTLNGSTVTFADGIVFSYAGAAMTVTGTPAFGKTMFVTGGLKAGDCVFKVDSEPDTLPKLKLLDAEGNPCGALWTRYVTEGEGTDAVHYIEAYSPGTKISIR